MSRESAASYPNISHKLIVPDSIGPWHDDPPLANWIAAPPEELPELLFHDPAGEAAQTMFAMPEDPEAVIAIQAGLGRV